MSDEATPTLGLAAIRTTHASPDSPRLRVDSCWLGREDIAELVAATRLAHPERIVVGFDSLSRLDDRRLSMDRARLAELDVRSVLQIGECGALAAEMTERGFVMPGDVVVGRGLAGHGVGGIGALYVRSDRPAEVAIAGAVDDLAGVSSAIELVGVRDRWVDAIDLALGLATALDRHGVGGGALEFSGPALLELATADRIVLCGVLGALRSAPVIADVDDHVLAWLRARAQRVPEFVRAAATTPELTLDVSSILPSIGSWNWHSHAVCDAPNMPISTVLVGGALGGRLEDLRVVARMFREHPIHPDVVCVVVPATPRTLLHAAHEGLVPVLLRAGVRIEAPGSRSFHALAASILDDGAALTTVFDERLDPPWSLVSPAVAAASAVLGRLAHPDEVLRRRKESV